MTVLNPQAPGEPSGSWDSIHVFEAAERGRQAHYKLTSTIMLQMVDRSISSRGSKDEVVKGKFSAEKTEQNDAKRDGEVTLSGSMTRQTEQDYQLQDQSSHISNTGKMVEEMEIKMRNLLQEVRLSLHVLEAYLGRLLWAHLTLRHHRYTLARLGMLSSICARLTTSRKHGDSENCRRSLWASSSGDEHTLEKRTVEVMQTCTHSACTQHGYTGISCHT